MLEGNASGRPLGPFVGPSHQDLSHLSSVVCKWRADVTPLESALKPVLCNSCGINTYTRGIDFSAEVARRAFAEDRFGDQLCTLRCRAASDFGQRTFEVGDQVFHVFDTHREPHQIVGNADALAHLRRDRGVGHQRGVRDERFDSAERFGQCA
jgi:hypothetical protein